MSGTTALAARAAGDRKTCQTCNPRLDPDIKPSISLLVCPDTKNLETNVIKFASPQDLCLKNGSQDSNMSDLSEGRQLKVMEPPPKYGVSGSLEMLECQDHTWFTVFIMSPLRLLGYPQS